MMDDRQQIYALYERMYKAMIAKDADVLRQVHAPDFVLVHMTGMRQSCEEYIRYIVNGTLNYYSAETENLDITVNGNEAVLRGRSRVTAAVFAVAVTPGGCSCCSTCTRTTPGGCSPAQKHRLIEGSTQYYCVWESDKGYAWKQVPCNP